MVSCGECLCLMGQHLQALKHDCENTLELAIWWYNALYSEWSLNTLNILWTMLNGLVYGVSEKGMDSRVKALNSGHGDTVQYLNMDRTTYQFICGSCDFKLIFEEYFLN